MVRVLPSVGSVPFTALGLFTFALAMLVEHGSVVIS